MSKQQHRDSRLVKADGTHGTTPAASGGTHTHSPAQIVPQGAGSTLNSDLLDGFHASHFAVAGSTSVIFEKDGVFVASGTNANFVTGTNINLSVVDTGGGQISITHDVYQGSGSGLDADMLDGYHAADFAVSVHNHVPGDIVPQGSGSTLDSDLLDGLHAADLALVAHTHTPWDIVPQGSGSGLDADTLDGRDSLSFENAGAVTSHEGTYDHTLLPTADEKAALVGTDGTPSVTNPYVTDTDPRLASGASNLSTFLTTSLELGLSNARYIASGANIGFTDGGGGGPWTISVVQGAGSGLDADTLDGSHAADFGTASSTTAILGMPFVTWSADPSLTNERSLAAGTAMAVTISGTNAFVSNTGVWSITGTANQVIASDSHENILLSTPQNIHTGASPTFVDMTLSSFALGTPTYTTLGDEFSQLNSGGIITGGDLSSGSAATCHYNPMTGVIKTSNSVNGENVFFDLASGTIALAAGMNWIYVDYNAGVPQVAATATRANMLSTWHVPLGRCYKDGTDVEALSNPTCLHNFQRENYERLVERGIMEWMTGAAIAEKATRRVTSTDGVFYVGPNRLATSAFDSSVTNFDHYYYMLNGAWTEVAATGQIDNLQYNLMLPAGSESLATLTANRYGVHWVYICFESELSVLYGQGDYTLAQAEAAQPPSSIPPYLQYFAVLAGKIVIQKSAATFTSVESAFTTKFVPTAIADHADLSGLLGDADYYHLSLAAYNNISAGTTATPQFARLGLGAAADANILGLIYKNDADTTNPALQLKQASSGDVAIRFQKTNSYCIGIDASLSNTLCIAGASSSEAATLGASSNILRFVPLGTAGQIYGLSMAGNAASGDIGTVTGNSQAGMFLGNSTYDNCAIFALFGRGAYTYGARFSVGRSRSASNIFDANTVLVNGDCIFDLDCYGADGADYSQAARITVHVDGTPGTNDMPGRIGFWTSPDGTEAAVERMRITNAGDVGLGVTPATKFDVGAGAITLLEMSAPGVGAANTVRIYAVDNGAGKTQLMAQFASGAAQQIAIEP